MKTRQDHNSFLFNRTWTSHSLFWPEVGENTIIFLLNEYVHVYSETLFQVPYNGGLLTAFSQVHGPNTSKYTMGSIYILFLANCLCTFQVYAMPVFDNLEARYTSKKQQRCPRWVRIGIRLFFGGLVFLVAVAFPFLGSLAPLIGGITLPLTLAYPCFMWLSMKKPRRNGYAWCLNLGLGCFGVALSVLLVVAAAWTLAHKGLEANFLKP